MTYFKIGSESSSGMLTNIRNTSLSSMYAARLAPFEKLLQNSNPRLQSVGKIGVNEFSKLRDFHLAHEKRAAVRGELA